jgi:hypothetical protein
MQNGYCKLCLKVIHNYTPVMTLVISTLQDIC